MNWFHSGRILIYSFDMRLCDIQMNTKESEDTRHTDSFLGISQQMLLKLTKGVFGKYCTKYTDSDMRSIT